MESIFDGWTSETQCFGDFFEVGADDIEHYCALGWTGTYGKRECKSYLERFNTFQRILPLLAARFPQLREHSDYEEAIRSEYLRERMIVYANDILRVPAEVFQELDLESQQLAEVL